MDQPDVPTHVVEAVTAELRTLRVSSRIASATSIENALSSFCIVERRRREKPDISPRQAVKELLTELLEQLKEEDAEYGDLLHNRYWLGKSGINFVFEHQLFWSERTFYYHQARAIRLMAFLLWEREQICKQGDR